MKWRTVWQVLAACLALAIIGGFALGHYLQKEVPQSANEVDTSIKDPAPIIGENGLPMAPEPPQPLPTGGYQLGEQGQNAVDWHIDPNNRTQGDATELSSANVQYQVVTGVTQGELQDGLVISKDEIGGTAEPQNVPEWLQSLQGMLHICRQMSFKERAPCVRQARQQYCTPNNGWGAFPECPASDAPDGVPVASPAPSSSESGGASDGSSDGAAPGATPYNGDAAGSSGGSSGGNTGGNADNANGFGF